MKHVARNEFVGFLRNHYRGNPGFLARTKAIYRPLICPFDRLLNLLPEKQRVLDIGYGTGAFLQLVAQYRSPCAVAGLEINPKLIERAQASFGSTANRMPARFEAYDGTMLPAWIGKYEYVFLVDTLHHISRDRQRQFLVSLFERLKPGAKLIIKDIDAGQPLWCLFNKLHDLLLAGQYAHERSAAELRVHLCQIGFAVTEMIKERIFVYPHYTLVAEKK